MSKFKTNDIVISRMRGFGIVIKSPYDGEQVLVRFNNSIVPHIYNIDGCLHGAIYPDLYHASEYPDYLERHQPPRPDLKVDDKVIVLDDDSSYNLRRHFSHWDESTGKIWCFNDGRTSFSVDSKCDVTLWRHYEIYKD